MTGPRGGVPVPREPGARALMIVTTGPIPPILTGFRPLDAIMALDDLASRGDATLTPSDAITGHRQHQRSTR